MDTIGIQDTEREDGPSEARPNQMILDRLEIINEEFHAFEIAPATLDRLLADGWRHFGSHFFRYNYGLYENEIRRVMPLRIALAGMTFSKSQRRVMRRNADLDVEIGPVAITDETHELFHRHKRRFKTGVPDSIYDFLSREADGIPLPALQIAARSGGKLLAASYFDVGADTVSSIYGIFDPDEAARGLGIFTMLKEIEFARGRDLSYYYHGYAYEGNSFYDYKKRFSGVEVYDWHGKWLPLAETP